MSTARKPRPNAEKIAARNQQIRLELTKGHTFATVAVRHDLSERQVRNIWDERKQLDSSDPRDNPQLAIRDEIEFYDALLAECVERGEATKNDSVWLGSIRTRAEIRARRFELMRLYGLLPDGYLALEYQNTFREVVEMICNALDDLDNADAILEELVETLRRRTKRQTER